MATTTAAARPNPWQGAPRLPSASRKPTAGEARRAAQVALWTQPLAPTSQTTRTPAAK